MAKSEKPINPVLKLGLELGPPIAFFVIYTRIKDDVFSIGGTEYSGFIVATIVFVPVLLVAMGILWALTRSLSRMQVFTAFMVIFFGGLTAWFNDERFFMMKTTIVYGVFCAILGLGLLQGRSYLAYVMHEMMPMRDEGWMILTRRLFWCFAALGVANELVWRNMSEAAWVKIETFAFPAILFLFLWWQVMQLQKYLIEPEAMTGTGDNSDPDPSA